MLICLQRQTVTRQRQKINIIGSKTKNKYHCNSIEIEIALITGIVNILKMLN